MGLKGVLSEAAMTRGTGVEFIRDDREKDFERRPFVGFGIPSGAGDPTNAAAIAHKINDKALLGRAEIGGIDIADIEDVKFGEFLGGLGESCDRPGEDNAAILFDRRVAFLCEVVVGTEQQRCDIHGALTNKFIFEIPEFPPGITIQIESVDLGVENVGLGGDEDCFCGSRVPRGN